MSNRYGALRVSGCFTCALCSPAGQVGLPPAFRCIPLLMRTQEHARHHACRTALTRPKEIVNPGRRLSQRLPSYHQLILPPYTLQGLYLSLHPQPGIPHLPVPTLVLTVPQTTRAPHLPQPNARPQACKAQLPYSPSRPRRALAPLTPSGVGSQGPYTRQRANHEALQPYG